MDKLEALRQEVAALAADVAEREQAAELAWQYASLIERKEQAKRSALAAAEAIKRAQAEGLGELVTNWPQKVDITNCDNETFNRLMAESNKRYEAVRRW